MAPALTARLAGSVVIIGAGGGALEALMVSVTLEVAVPHALLTNTSTGKFSTGSLVVASVKLALVSQAVRGVELDSHI